MAKLTRDEFNSKYSERITENDDLLIELMEDFEDSVNSDSSEELTKLRSELEKALNDYLELKEKYKNRFLEAKEIKKEDDDILEEKEVIDIQEI